MSKLNQNYHRKCRKLERMLQRAFGRAKRWGMEDQFAMIAEKISNEGNSSPQ